MSITVESMFGPLPKNDAWPCEACGRLAEYGVVLDDGRLARYCAIHLVLKAGAAVGLL